LRTADGKDRIVMDELASVVKTSQTSGKNGKPACIAFCGMTATMPPAGAALPLIALENSKKKAHIDRSKASFSARHGQEFSKQA
jgi:hypothetical protein